ncbi:MAG: DUF2283 domain-containing protein [Thermodesulfobacteriota bacterium]|nr:DUF2283 domain-containing protein [Thermodesulfobacteriota bacterium]
MHFLIDLTGRQKNESKYFSGTDTAHVEFTDNNIHETREISENIYIDIDENGHIVSMTIKHARNSAGIWEFSYQAIPRHSA